MMILLFFFGIAFILFIILFTSPKFSPIPYFPSNKRDVPEIVSTLHLSDTQVLIDLGAGDGTIIFESAKRAYNMKLETQFIGIEINIILCFFMNVRKLFHPNRSRIHIVRNDMFAIDYSNLVKEKTGKDIHKAVFYVYVSPWFTPQIGTMISCIPVRTRIVSYFYPIFGKNPTKQRTLTNNLYVYELGKIEK